MVRILLVVLALLGGCRTSRVAEARYGTLHGQRAIVVEARTNAPRDEKIDIDVWHEGERVAGGVGTGAGEFVVSSGIENLPDGAEFDIRVRYYTEDDRLTAARRWTFPRR